MSAADNLQPQLFHGTGHEVGPLVLPGNAAGHTNFSSMKTVGGKPVKSQAFATEREHVAWDFAHTSAGNSAMSRSTGMKARPRVYEVHPNPESQLGMYNANRPRFNPARRQDLAEHVAPHWRVKEQLDTQPGHQGTFPQLNWNQFGKKTFDSFTGEHNHPTLESVHHGEWGSSRHQASVAAEHSKEPAQAHKEDFQAMTKDHPGLF